MTKNENNFESHAGKEANCVCSIINPKMLLRFFLF